MPRVEVEIEETEVDGRPGLKVTCAKCGHETCVYGQGLRSARRAAIMLKEECPEGEENFYKVDESEFD